MNIGCILTGAKNNDLVSLLIASAIFVFFAAIIIYGRIEAWRSGIRWQDQ